MQTAFCPKNFAKRMPPLKKTAARAFDPINFAFQIIF